jgi:alkylresorcinol/alkylpyrone synthase
VEAVKILASATAVPPLRLRQEEVFRLLGYTSPRALQIFLNSDIEYRHFWADASTFTPQETPDERLARYSEGATHLACLAARKALDNAGIAADELAAIFVASCTGYVCPDLATRLIGHLGLRDDVQRAALLGHGCAGAMSLLQRASDFAEAHPAQKVLAIAVEVCSAAYFVDRSLETVVGNAICADGAAAVVMEKSGHNPAATAQENLLPRILAFRSVLDPSHLDKVGFGQQDGKLRIILSAEIRDLAGPMIEKCLQRLLASLGITRGDVRFWILHPGGRKVIDTAADYLGLREEQLTVSRHVLRNYGNMSSPTVLFVLDEIWSSQAPKRGDLGVMMALGPGFAAEGALLQW